MADEKRSEGKPHDRMTRLGAAMIETLEANPEYRDTVRTIIFLTDGDRSGVALHGFASDHQAMAEIFMHMRAVFRANGQDLLFAPLGQG